jgi:WD40 repeat protein
VQTQPEKRQWSNPVTISTVILIIGCILAAALAFRLWASRQPPPQAVPVQTWTIHKPVSSVAFSPDGQLLAAGISNGDIQMRDVPTGTLIRTLAGHTAAVRGLAFSPDGSLLASGADKGDASVRLWQVVDGGPMRTLTGHTARVESLAFSPDGQYLASGGWQMDI